MVQEQKSDFQEKQAHLSAAKRALLEKRLRGKTTEYVKKQTIPTYPAQGIVPLSFAQQGLWFLDQLAPNSPLYNIPTVLRLSGPLNIALLQQSINAIVQRHTALQTTFIKKNDQPMQHISSTAHVDLPVIDLSDLSHAQRECQVNALSLLDAQKPFDLQQLPLLRTTLLRLASDEYVFLLTLHHIISDGWSIAIFMQELATLYTAYTNGENANLPTLPIQFTDYARWQREYLQGDVQENLLAYWKKQLAGASHYLDLPTDRPRPALQTFRGKRNRKILSHMLTQSLKHVSQREGVTLFMTLLATFQTLLSRYTGQLDILVGSPIANRSRRETEEVIGYFLNTLVLRTSLAGDPTFQELVKRVSEVTLEAYAHQDLPFQQLITELHVERDPSRAPLFQIMFVMQNTPEATMHMANIDMQQLSVDPEIAKFDITLDISETDGGLQVDIEYNSDLFDAATIERMHGHFQTLLEGIVAHPEQRISTLPLLTFAEKQLLITARTTHIDYPNQHCLHTLFEEQAQRVPNAIALTCEEASLSYRELDQRANQLAHHLQHLGIGPDVLVGLYLERNIDLIVALLAILKAGGAYLPLDPNYPADRIAFMLQDAQVPVLLTQTQLLQNLPSCETSVFCLDRDWEQVAHQPHTTPINQTTGDNLAYVIYTSGSTGRPKGVMVSHFNVMRLFAATAQWYHFTEHDVWTLFHSYAFDFSVWELWGALLYGGRLVIVPYLISRSPEAFYNLLCSEHVTVLNQTPSAFRQLIHFEESLQTDSQIDLRLVIFGGEALELQMLKPWFKRHGDQRPQLVNMYGITETTVHVTYRPITSADVEKQAGSVIGCPIPDLRLYLLDQQRQLVPIGVPGELYVGGAGVARGYLNRSALTHERFIVDPFVPDAEERLYKSGDLARYLPDGDIEYLGRIDHQVKIRGFRIELGEIETLLRQHPSVRDVIIIAREYKNGERRIIAYITTRDTTPTTSHLRYFLKQQLPEYMLPFAFVFMETLPLTANGKIDRHALPEPALARPEQDKAFVMPQTAEEQMIAEIWCQVLGLKSIGIDDNFFVLGGDSIRIIQVLSGIRAKGYNISLSLLLQHQTISTLAQALPTLQQTTDPIRQKAPFRLLTSQDRSRMPSPIEDAYPLTHLQMGMFFHSEFDTENTLYHDVNSEHIHLPFSLPAFQNALVQLAVRHPILRTAFDFSTFSEPLQLVYRSVTLPLQVEDIRSLSPTEQDIHIRAWFEAEKHIRFDWQQAPLLRLYVHTRSDTSFQFSFSEHHAIFDGWSVVTMLTELLHLYLRALGYDIPPVEPAPTSTFGDFVELERQTLSDAGCRSYWSTALTDYHYSHLPHRSSPLPPGQKGQFTQYNVPLPPLSTQRLKHLAQQAQVPLKSVLLAAHLCVLRFMSGHIDVLTGLVTNGRLEESDGERLLGLFLNTVPLRFSLIGGTWLGLIQQTFQAEQALLPYRRYPLAEIQQLASGHSLFEVAFNYVHFHATESLYQRDGFSMEDELSFTETNFPFTTEFVLGVPSNELSLSLEYTTALLTEQQVQAIGAYYVQALSAMITDPYQRYETVSLLSDEEREQLLYLWSQEHQETNEQDEDDMQICLHHLFEAQVARTPQGIAVVADTQQITYQALDRRANQLAHVLRQRGVRSDLLVGVYLERSLDLIVTLLAILKAGGAYVPLDPSYPAERLSFLLHDAQVSFLLTSQSLVSSLSDALEQGLHVFCLDQNVSMLAQQPTHAPACEVTPDDVAYVIYTSGSTGQPKGAMIPHRSIAAFALSAGQTYTLSPADRVLQFTSLSWDTSAEEIYPCLTHGATLVLRPADMLDAPAIFLSRCQQLQITVLNLPTAYWHALVGSLHPQDAVHSDDLRLVIIGGEKVHPEHVIRWRTLASPTIQLLNTYGVAEATVEATCYKLAGPEAEVDVPQEIPIGTPFCGCHVYVLDTYQQPVPVGVTGEIYLGGPGIAHGYLRRPALTAERFIPDRFSTKVGQRLYKTGDMARYRADGMLEYVGRVDDQVKIRGYRIEVAEIEAVLTRHHAIREAVLVAREDTAGNKQLVAYVVNTHGETLNERDVRRFVQDHLPAYMVPSRVVRLESLPLTTNGKVDRQRLPQPEQEITAHAENYLAPRNALEVQLVAIWEDVFGIQGIGIRDDFFELGGHSLLAIRLMSQIHRTFDHTLSLSMLFASGTIERLATTLQQQKIAQQSGSLIALQSGGTKLPFFCVHPVGGNVLCYVELARQLGPDQPFYALQAVGVHGDEEPLTSIEDMAHNYIDALLTVQPHGPYLLGGWSLGGTIAFEMAQQLLHQNHEVALLALLDSTAPSNDQNIPEYSNVSLAEQFMLDLAGLADADLVEAEAREDFRRLDPDTQITVLLQKMQHLNLIPPEIELAQVRRYLRIYQANIQAENQYQPASFSGHVALFKAIEQCEDASLVEMRGWQKFVTGNIETFAFSCDHYALLRKPAVQLLAERLSACANNAI